MSTIGLHAKCTGSKLRDRLIINTDYSVDGLDSFYITKLWLKFMFRFKYMIFENIFPFYKLIFGFKEYKV